MSIIRLKQVNEFYNITKNEFLKKDIDKWKDFYINLDKEMFNIYELEKNKEAILNKYGKSSNEYTKFDDMVSEEFSKWNYMYISKGFYKLIYKYNIILDDKEIDIWNNAIDITNSRFNIKSFSRVTFHKKSHVLKCKMCNIEKSSESNGINKENYICDKCICWNTVLSMYKLAYKNNYRTLSVIRNIEEIVYSHISPEVKSYNFRVMLEDRGININEGIEKIWNIANDELLLKNNLSIGRWEYSAHTEKFNNGVKTLISMFK